MLKRLYNGLIGKKGDFILFNSLHFLIFFPIVVLFYFLVPFRYRWILLLAASYYFYMCWKAEYLLLILLSTLIDYICGLKMAGCAEKKNRAPYLLLSLASNLGILFTFKYFNFFSTGAQTIADHLNIFYHAPSLQLLLPVGISFYTFQAVSYSIDVYRGTIPAEKHLGYFALFIAYFPQLVAGPIERCKQLLPQLKREHKFNYHRMRDGLIMILWGLFRKIVIADTLAIYVEDVFANYGNYGGLNTLLAAYLFAFQVYLDFAAYSDIAIGAAKVMGVKLMTNFRHPFLSTSMSELWRRWHISLMTWFRDYIFLPLCKKDDTVLRRSLIILLIFFISGLWHGANWTFVTWGVLNGVFLIIENQTVKLRKNIYDKFFGAKLTWLKIFIKTIVTFNIFALLTIFFRSQSLEQAFTMLGRILDLSSYSLNFAAKHQSLIIFSTCILTILMVIEIFEEKYSFVEIVSMPHIAWRWIIYYGLAIACIYFVPYNPEQFIYFQF